MLEDSGKQVDYIDFENDHFVVLEQYPDVDSDTWTMTYWLVRDIGWEAAESVIADLWAQIDECQANRRQTLDQIN